MAPVAVAVDQPFDADGLYGLRAALAAHADHLGAGTVEIENLLIVASELAANAVRHGGGVGRVRLWRDARLLRCEVSDQGPGMADPNMGTVRPDSTTLGGRGLWISRQLCADLVIETGPRGTVVTATIPILAADAPNRTTRATR